MSYKCPNCNDVIWQLQWYYFESHGHTVEPSESSPDEVHVMDDELTDDTTPFNQRYECPSCNFIITDDTDTAKKILREMTNDANTGGTEPDGDTYA